MKKMIRKTLIKICWIALISTVCSCAAVAQTSSEMSDFWHHGWNAARQITDQNETRISVGINKPPSALVTQNNRAQFDLGFAFIRSAFYASASDQNTDFSDRAILELAKLSARFDAQPEIQIALDKILKNVVRGQGTADERWRAVIAIAELHGTQLAVEPKWYYQAGIVLTRLHLSNLKRNQEDIRKELQNLEILSKIAPNSAPSELLGMISSLTSVALPINLTNSEFLTIDDVVGNILGLIYA
ncbi:MAG: hypothetical protein ABI954_12255 [Pyrinomonadaceae bacterium]